MKPTNVGDRVRYSAAWLRSTGQLIGEVPFRIGTVTSLVGFGSMVVAMVRWDDEPDHSVPILPVNLAVKGIPEPA